MPTLTISKRLPLAIISGLISYFAYPSPDFWPAIFISIAGIYLSLRGASFWGGFGVGFTAGLALYTAQIYWISQYLGPEPLLALAGLEAVIFAMAAGFMALVSTRYSSSWLIALFVGCLWTGREWFATHFPYGGFPWSRVAMSQANSPLAFWVSIGGFGLLSFLIVTFVVFVTECTLRKATYSNISIPVIAALLFAVPLAIAAIPVSAVGHMRIAGIQGNANAGLFANEKPGTILQNHLDATEKLLESGKEFDLVVWPENASDINPDDSEPVKEALTELVDKKLKTPFIFGTITTNGDKMFNSSKLWLPGRGEVDQYDKKRPVPFGEYVPDRSFFYKLAPDLVGLIYRGYDFGTRDGIFKVNGTKIGVLICFEEAIDELPRDLVSENASVIVAQTNNADFGHSDESVQQLAIARLRAIETGRAIVNISTVGPSAIIDRNGKLLDSSPAYVSDFVVSNVPKYEDKTLAMLGGWLFDPIMAIISALLATWLIIDGRRRSTKL